MVDPSIDVVRCPMYIAVFVMIAVPLPVNRKKPSMPLLSTCRPRLKVAVEPAARSTPPWL